MLHYKASFSTDILTYDLEKMDQYSYWWARDPRPYLNNFQYVYGEATIEHPA